MARIILRDGKVAELRRAEKTVSDHELVKALFEHASPDSLYFRFFHTVREIDAALIDSMLEGNGTDQLSLLCLAGDKALGIGTYVRVNDETAEVAFLVDDALHGKGFGSLLLEHLAQEAWHHGFKQFEAYVLNGNYKMLQVFRASGYQLKQTFESGTMHLVLPLTHTERTRSIAAVRDKMATSASLEPFFAPKTVAVVGASRHPQGLGQQVFRNILAGGFQGTVYPVNPSTQTVASVRAYPTLMDLPEPVDLVVVVVPAAEVLDVVDQCIESRARAVTILSAGFAEKDEAGALLQREVVRRLRGSGCRLIGPNSLGLINTVPTVQLNASLARNIPAVQGMSIASQSGALGIAILEYANRMGVGVTHFVSMGNKADVSSNDLVQFWEDDPATKLIALYIESFGNPRKFSRLARRITRKKPMLVVKGAQSPLTQSISGTIGGPPSAASEAVVDALFQQTGVIRLSTLQEMFDVAALISTNPLPKGRRVAIVTNSAGGAVITADALLKEGLTFVSPVIDLGFDALAEGYRQVLPQVLQDPSVDAVVVLFIPVGLTERENIVAAIAEAIDEVSEDVAQQKPIVANFLATGDYLARYIDTKTRRVPVYPFPEQAVSALAKVADYADYLMQDVGHVPDLTHADTDLARSVVRRELPTGRLPSFVCSEVFSAMGIQDTFSPSATDITMLKIGIDISSDPLFGPVLRLTRLLDDTSNRVSIPVQSVLRITPLTNLGAWELVQTIHAWQPSLDDSCKMVLADLFLRLSLLVEEIPEVSSVCLPSVQVGKKGYCLGHVQLSTAVDASTR